MPTVILLDVSLSMCRMVPVFNDSGNSSDNSTTQQSYQLKTLAAQGLNSFLDYQTQNCKLEFTSLMVYSSLWELVVPFTRDYEQIKSALINVESFDKTNIINALRGVHELVIEEWGTTMPIQIILVTDGNAGIDALMMNRDLTFGRTREDVKWPLPFPFPCKLHIVCISPASEPSMKMSLPFFQKLIDLSNRNNNTSVSSTSFHKENDINSGGQIWIPDGPTLSAKSIQQMFINLAETNYKPFRGTLRCGNLSSPVALYPPPENYVQVNDFEILKAEFSHNLEICGYMEIKDIASPPVHSRHLVLPLPASKEEVKKYASILVTNPNNPNDTGSVDIDEMVNAMCSDEGKQPSFCVLLHGSLKVEGMVAICQVGQPNWFGMLYSWADNKKKSNLMLSTFHCGSETVAWLGDMKSLGFPNLNIRMPPNELNKISEIKSFSQNSVVWVKQSGLQGDIQKILRHARKLPDKTPNFYKELNRLRKAALAFGFYELLDGLARILERECTLLPGTAHPDAALQLTHAANALKAPTTLDSYNEQIMPLKTKFSSSD